MRWDSVFYATVAPPIKSIGHTHVRLVLGASKAPPFAARGKEHQNYDYQDWDTDDKISYQDSYARGQWRGGGLAAWTIP